MLNWHWIFFVNLIVGAIAIPLAIRLLPSKAGARTDRLDFLGLALMSAGLVAITYGLAEAGTYGSFSNARVWVPVALAGWSWWWPSRSTRCGSSTRCSICASIGTVTSPPPRS